MSLPVTRQQGFPVARHTVEQLRFSLENYRENVSAPTWAGTAAYLGIPRALLDAYLAGKIDADDPQGISELLALHKTHLEAFLETVLTRERGSPAGAQFALKNQHGWEDKMSFDLNARPQLSIVVDGGSELAKLLSRSDVEDAEVIEDDDWLG